VTTYSSSSGLYSSALKMEKSKSSIKLMIIYQYVGVREDSRNIGSSRTLPSKPSIMQGITKLFPQVWKDS